MRSAPTAEPLYKRSVAILEKALGPNIRGTTSLPPLHKARVRDRDAGLLYKRALVIQKAALKSN
jgi:hypothetical protein